MSDTNVKRQTKKVLLMMRSLMKEAIMKGIIFVDEDRPGLSSRVGNAGILKNEKAAWA